MFDQTAGWTVVLILNHGNYDDYRVGEEYKVSQDCQIFNWSVRVSQTIQILSQESEGAIIGEVVNVTALDLVPFPYSLTTHERSECESYYEQQGSLTLKKVRTVLQLYQEDLESFSIYKL